MLQSDIQSTRSHERRGDARRALSSGLAGGLLALAGCAADPEPTDATGEREVVERESEILGELETRDGAQLTFTAERERGDGDDEPVVAITELAPGGARSYLARLRDRGATSLEAFLALAPAGTEAPAVLREAHAREAVALGRSAELRAISLEAATTVALTDSPICDSYAAFTNAINTLAWSAAQIGSSTESHSLPFHDGGNLFGYMCNQDDALQDYKIAQFCYEVSTGGPFGTLSCGSKVFVPDGYLASQFWVNATTDRVVRAEKVNGVSVMSYLGIFDQGPED